MAGGGPRRRGPSPLRLVLPLALLGGTRLMMGGRGRHGGPFGPGGGPHDDQPPFGQGREQRGPRFGGDRPGGRPPFRFPFGPFGGPGGPFGPGPRAKRGDVRAGILALLTEEPRNGYQIIQELAQRSHGAWRPSSGAVYPALQQLEDEGLVRAEERDSKRTFVLTDEGRAYIATHREEVAAPWDAMSASVGEGAREVGEMIQQVAMAAMQVIRTGNAAQVAEAKRTLGNARRALYRILAEDEGTDTAAQDNAVEQL